jgi:transcriptional regulator with XRE-family HTH domain
MIKIPPLAVTAARNLLNLTQQELADVCQISHATLSGVEGGTVQPRAETMRKIARELTKRGIEFSNGTGIGVRLDYKKAAAYKASLSEQPPVEGVD